MAKQKIKKMKCFQMGNAILVVSRFTGWMIVITASFALGAFAALTLKEQFAVAIENNVVPIETIETIEGP